MKDGKSYTFVILESDTSTEGVVAINKTDDTVIVKVPLWCKLRPG